MNSRPRRGRLSQQVAVVEFDSSLNQQLAILLFEIHLSVMLLLALDVFNQPGNLALGTSERPISLLPMGEPFENCILLDPMRGACLDLLDEIGQADRGMEAGKNMQMVLHTVDAIQVAATLPDDAPDVAEKVFPPILRERGCSVLRGKNDVVPDGGMS